MSRGRALLALDMNTSNPNHHTSNRNSHGAVRWIWLAVAGALIVLLAVLLPRASKGPRGDAGSTEKPAPTRRWPQTALKLYRLRQGHAEHLLHALQPRPGQTRSI